MVDLREWPKQGRAPHRKYVCPVCRVEFVGCGAIVGGKGGKECPNGHFHTMGQLYRFEKTGTLPEPRPEKVPKPPKPPKPKRNGYSRTGAAPAIRAGMTSDRDRYQLAATAMLAGYDRAIATLPPGVRMMVEGAFGAAPSITREIVGAKA